MIESDPRFLFGIDFGLAENDQKSLCDWIMGTGVEIAGVYGNAEPYWKARALRVLDIQSVTNEQFQFFKKNPEKFADFCYFARLQPSFTWKWSESKECRRVQDLLSPLWRYYSRLTRVAVFLQQPGMLIPAHRDLVAGIPYPDLRGPFNPEKGRYSGLYEGAPWYRELTDPLPVETHRHQDYLALKVPLSLKSGDYGKPFILQGGVRHQYFPEGRAFFINEYEMEHGALPAEHVRGVIFIDGFLDRAKIAEVPKTPLRLQRI